MNDLIGTVCELARALYGTAGVLLDVETDGQATARVAGIADTQVAAATHAVALATLGKKLHDLRLTQIREQAEKQIHAISAAEKVLAAAVEGKRVDGAPL